MERETVGKLSLDLLNKSPETLDPIELEREIHKEYIKELEECVKTSSKIIHGNFYVVVITKKERLMQNVLRHYFLARQSCPTPDYDQTVFLYRRDAELLEFLWVIPDRETCIHLKINAIQVHKSERHLLDFILKFADGSLFELSKKLNGEKSLETPLLA